MAHRHRLHLIVGDVDRCCPQRFLELNDSCPGAGAQLGVQIAEGFIHQEHSGFPSHGSPQGHPLFLASG